MQPCRRLACTNEYARWMHNILGHAQLKQPLLQQQQQSLPKRNNQKWLRAQNSKQVQCISIHMYACVEGEIVKTWYFYRRLNRHVWQNKKHSKARTTNEHYSQCALFGHELVICTILVPLGAVSVISISCAFLLALMQRFMLLPKCMLWHWVQLQLEPGWKVYCFEFWIVMWEVSTEN